jgi:ActR/RegA family two-component response regulator
MADEGVAEQGAGRLSGISLTTDGTAEDTGNGKDKQTPFRATERRPTVLVVDDRESIRRSLIELLGERFRVVAVATFDAAIQATHETPPVAAVVDLNLGWGTTTGLDLIRALRNLNPKSRLVVFTGYVDADHRRQSRDAGADVIIEKPDTASVVRACAAAADRMAE